MTKSEKRNERLRNLVGIDLCACGGGHKVKCDGICRQNHIKNNEGVKCPAVYQVHLRDHEDDSL